MRGRRGVRSTRESTHPANRDTSRGIRAGEHGRGVANSGLSARQLDGKIGARRHVCVSISESNQPWMSWQLRFGQPSSERVCLRAEGTCGVRSCTLEFLELADQWSYVLSTTEQRQAIGAFRAVEIKCLCRRGVSPADDVIELSCRRGASGCRLSPLKDGAVQLMP